MSHTTHFCVNRVQRISPLVKNPFSNFWCKIRQHLWSTGPLIIMPCAKYLNFRLRLENERTNRGLPPLAVIASMHLESAKKRPLEETSCDTEVDAKKRARTQEPLSPERSDSVVVASSAAPSPTAPKIPSPAASSIHTSPNVPHVAELPTYFVDFSVNVYNSSAEQKPFQRSIIVSIHSSFLESLFGRNINLCMYERTCKAILFCSSVPVGSSNCPSSISFSTGP